MVHPPARGCPFALPGFSPSPPSLWESGTVRGSPGSSAPRAPNTKKVHQQPAPPENRPRTAAAVAAPGQGGRGAGAGAGAGPGAGRTDGEERTRTRWTGVNRTGWTGGTGAGAGPAGRPADGEGRGGEGRPRAGPGAEKRAEARPLDWVASGSIWGGVGARRGAGRTGGGEGGGPDPGGARRSGRGCGRQRGGPGRGGPWAWTRAPREGGRTRRARRPSAEQFPSHAQLRPRRVPKSLKAGPGAPSPAGAMREQLLLFCNWSTLGVCAALKLPQISAVLAARSARGISLPSLLLELAG